MEVFRWEMETSNQNSSIFSPHDGELIAYSKTAAANALTAIKDVTPELHSEMSKLITDILIIDSNKTNAASSFQAFGVIYLKTLKPFQTWTTYVEHLVHEAAHHLLFAIFHEFQIFLKGTQERFASPLRSEARPLDAVFHAMFVLSRIIYILRKISESAYYESFDRTATYSFYNPKPLIEQFRDGFAVVSNAAQLTEQGIAFLSGIKQFAEDYAFEEQPLRYRD